MTVNKDPKLCLGVTYSVEKINFHGQGEIDWNIEVIKIDEDKSLQGILK